jgi:rod shape-determining protein MreC
VTLNLIQNDSKKLKIGLNIAVLSLALYGVSKRQYDYEQSTKFQSLMIDTFAPVQRAVTSSQESISSFFKDYALNVSASKQNEILLQEIAELESKLFSVSEMTQENRRLKDLLQFGEEMSGTKVMAQIVAWDSSSDFKTLRINKGLKDGLQLQSTVVTADGLVGYVYRLTHHFADVLTVLDPNNRTDVIIQRTRSQGIMEGFGASRGLVKYVNRTEPIILGDEVITSGLGHIYPKGIRIGRVSRLERESYGITQYVEVKPSVDFSRLEEVMVLISDNEESKRLEWRALEQVETGQVR